MTQRTPLYELHLELGARMVAFAGWEMPVSYPLGVMGEHAAARGKAALFDVSHMAQVELRGDGAARALEALVPASIAALPEGKARYTFFTDAQGGILDDLIVSNAGDHLYMVVNAARRDHDIPYMRANVPAPIEIIERTDLALIALQGPLAEGIMAPLVPQAAALKFMETCTATLDGVALRVSRLGYTGEDGYEISVPAGQAAALARRLLAHEGVEPAGLGARDSLRLEAGLCLYGNDIDATTSPIEAGLGWAIQKRRREEGGFPGAGRILREIADGPARKLVGLRPEGRAPARAGTEVADADGRIIGHVTSGGFGPTLGGPVSMGYVETGHAAPGTPISLIVRGKALPGHVASLPFVPHTYKR
ncbi:glycine cleavage system aminomethyltransferase GcvT [Halovulum dunhuangense]|uniref:aminomethyltransferase n=1 Tax=Halovulum dunhuangense TaxID=1505036 RepID=A0A849L425_9RHOB|nr:glycine cleavage system aminomethyltransferase GcvT [Halovulum dunhuangense]NNU80954.1 glycine cleavage system aminomethyltransferase GcvT [Halovulum dunhuangense]